MKVLPNRLCSHIIHKHVTQRNNRNLDTAIIYLHVISDVYGTVNGEYLLDFSETVHLTRLTDESLRRLRNC